jgi:hypothetical protein
MRLTGLSLIERIAASRSKNAREWFRKWLEIQRVEDPSGAIRDELAGTNKKRIVVAILQVVAAFVVVHAFIGWVRKWW